MTGYLGPTYSDVDGSRLQAVKEAREMIIKHVELATNSKHIMVGTEDKYIPLEEAKKLGLVSHDYLQ